MYQIIATSGYRKSFKRLAGSGKFPINKINDIIDTLASGKVLDEKHKDHQLKGELKAYRECHVFSDLLLIYKIEKKELILMLIDIGTHSEIFG